MTYKLMVFISTRNKNEIKI